MIKILMTCYNMEQYIGRSILSLLAQQNKDWHCYILNDLSLDKSIKIAADIIGNDPRFTIINNKGKLFQVGNYDTIVRSNLIEDSDTIVELDGDDWFADNFVLSRVQEIYNNPNIWIAYGSFRYSNGRPGFASPISNINLIRKTAFTASHLRTWKAFLWRQIKVEDLKTPDSKYFMAAGDVAFMFPMLEMAWPNNFVFMKDINYIYNDLNPLNEHKQYMAQSLQISSFVRNKPPYSKWSRQ